MNSHKLAFAAALLVGAVGSAAAGDIEHAMGTTSVPDDPQRIVVLTNEGTEALLALGISPVGAAQSWTGNPWYDHIEDAMADVVNLGTENAVNLELIAALEPDLILGNKQRHEEIYPQLSAIAPAVLSERLRGDWRPNLLLYADAVGASDAGAQVLAAFDSRVAGLRAQLGDQIAEEVSVVRFLPGHIRIYQLDSFSGVILSDLGFARPEIQNVDEFALRVGRESIPDMDGDRIIHFTYDNGDGEGVTQRDDALNDQLWQSLSAVQAGRVSAVDDVVWNTAGGILAANLMLDDVARIYGLE